MSVRAEFILPGDHQFPYDWQGTQASVRFVLDQVDGLVAAIEAGQLTGITAARELQLLMGSANSDAHGGAVLYGDEASYEANKAFWDFALRQGEKARAAYDRIKDVPTGKELVRLFAGARSNCDDHLQFFRTVCTQGTQAAIDLKDGPNPHRARR